MNLQKLIFYLLFNPIFVYNILPTHNPQHEDKPGGAVEQREYPAGEDDPLGPGQGADALKKMNNDETKPNYSVLHKTYLFQHLY